MVPDASATEVTVIHSIGDAFAVVAGGQGPEIHCSKCDFSFGARSEDPKLAAVVAERSIVESSDLNEYGAVDDLVLREYYCPGCGAMIAANVQQHGDAVLREIQLG
jgi:acetone carboxylase gamma subunit